MSWGTLDKGILTKTVDEKRSFDSVDCRKKAPWWKMIDKEPRYIAVRKLIPFLNERGHSLLELAVGHNLLYDEISTVICGTRNLKQLESLIRAFDNLPTKNTIEKALELANE